MTPSERSPQRVVVAVQARLGSSRLPRKALAPLLGRPLIERLIERVGQARRAQQIIITTSDQAEDDALAELAVRLGVLCARGPVNDLAARLHGAAQLAQADLLVRVWGDCPCMDPGVIDLAIEHSQGYDYLNNARIGDGADGFIRSFPFGLDIEVYRAEVLRGLAEDEPDPYFREFLVQALHRPETTWRFGRLDSDQDYSDVHLSVDWPEDLELVRFVFERLYQPGRAFGFHDAVALLRAHPEVVCNAELPRNQEFLYKKQAHDTFHRASVIDGY